MSVDGFNWITGWIPKAEVSRSAADLRVLLAQHHNKSGRCNPSRQLLAEELDRSERTVRRATKALREAGQIKTYRCRAQGGPQGKAWDSLAYVLVPASGCKAPKTWTPKGARLVEDKPLEAPLEEVEPRMSPSSGGRGGQHWDSSRLEEGAPLGTKAAHNKKEQGRLREPSSKNNNNRHVEGKENVRTREEVEAEIWKELEAEIRPWEEAAEKVASDPMAVARFRRAHGLSDAPSSEGQQADLPPSVPSSVVVEVASEAGSELEDPFGIDPDPMAPVPIER